MSKYRLTNTVRVERARHNITQAILASEVGCSRQTIHAIEKGVFEPRTSLAIRIAEYFKLNVEDIFSVEPI